jgi:amidase
LFCAGIWESIGGWVKEVNLEFKKDTFVDFSYMASIDKTQLTNEIEYKNFYAAALQKFLSPGSMLCIPTTPDVAPFRSIEYNKTNEFNYEKLRPLISLASLGGLPQISVPLQTREYEAPMGVSLISGLMQDYLLINTVKKILTLVNNVHANIFK